MRISEVGAGGSDGDGISSDDDTQNVLRSVKSMITTLDQVVDVLVPLLPKDKLNVVSMWNEEGQIRTQHIIEKFYEANKSTLKNEDMLVLLSFADQQLHVMKEMGLVTSSIEALGQNMLKQYKHVTVREMRRWQQNIFDHEVAGLENSDRALKLGCDDEERLSGHVTKNSHTGLRTEWPEELMASLWSQVDLAVSQLRSATKLEICVLALNQVPIFVQNMHNYFEEQLSKAGLLSKGPGAPTSSPDRNKRSGMGNIRNSIVKGFSTKEDRGIEVREAMLDRLYPHICASINNNRRFGRLLMEHYAILLPRLVDVQQSQLLSTLQELWARLSTLFSKENAWHTKCLARLIRLELVREVEEDLFSQAWYSAKLLAQNLSLTFKSYYDELVVNIFSGEDVQNLTIQVMKHIQFAYIKQILTAGISIGAPEIVTRLLEDVSILKESFSSLGDKADLNTDAVNEAFAPLNHVVHCMTMSTGLMSQFIKTELTRDFGTHAVVVWHTIMAIREEKKEVCDNIHGQLLYPDGRNGLGNATAAPLVDISAFKDHLCGGRNRRMVGSSDGKPSAHWGKIRATVVRR